MKNELMKKFPDLSGFDNKLLSQCIEWDVVHYLVEDAYKEKLKKPLFLIDSLLFTSQGIYPAAGLVNGLKVIY